MLEPKAPMEKMAKMVITDQEEPLDLKVAPEKAELQDQKEMMVHYCHNHCQLDHLEQKEMMVDQALMVLLELLEMLVQMVLLDHKVKLVDQEKMVDLEEMVNPVLLELLDLKVHVLIVHRLVWLQDIKPTTIFNNLQSNDNSLYITKSIQYLFALVAFLNSKLRV